MDISSKDSIWWLIIGDVLNVALPKDAQQALERVITSRTQATMLDAYILMVAGRMLHQPNLLERSKHVVDSLVVSSSKDVSLYYFAQQVSQPDVRATSVGLWATGKLQARGPSAATFFTDEAGTWVTTPGTERGSGNDVTMQTLYFGALLANGDPQDHVIMW